MNTTFANSPVQMQAEAQFGNDHELFDAAVLWTAIRPEDFPGKARIDVLFVDEHLQVQEMMATYFRGHGLTVITASNAEAAMRLPDEWQVGVMVIDADFANNGGTQLTRYLRANHPTTPIVLRTLPEQVSGLETANRPGATCCVSREESPEALLTAIAGVRTN